ncbi:MAG: hypothetical protein L6Q60_16210 [Rhodocyclaceae bacterium]|nr:hypothetical protein [Rhodocyclaceae bacterium]
MSNRLDPLAAGGRLLGASVVAFAAVVLAGEALVAALLPTMRSLVEVLAPDFVVENLRLTQLQSDRVIRLDIANRYHLFFEGRRISPGRSINATINVLLPLMSTVTGLITVLAWPGSLRRLACRLAVALPLLSALLVVDAPLALVALTWDFWLHASRSGEISLWSLWMQFVTRGGRPALGIVGGVAAVLAADWLLARHRAARLRASGTATATSQC